MNLDAILSEVENLNDITLTDIPDLDLYMDQVTTLFESKLSSNKRSEEDKILTKTMINNYAKAKIFPPIKSKKYSKNQIILLCLIYNLKQCLSLSDIGSLFKPINENLSAEDTDSSYAENLYSSFLDLKKATTEDFTKNFKKLIAEIDNKTASISDKETTSLLLTVFLLIENANMNIRASQKIIDSFFLGNK